MELREFKRVLRQVLLIPVVVLLALAGILIWQFQESNATLALIEQSDHRLALDNRLAKLIVDEETGLRGYQTTSDTRFLDPFYRAEPLIEDAVAELRAITQAGPNQGVNLDRFVERHRLWHETFAAPLIAAISAGGNTSDVELNLQGKARMDAVRESLDIMMQTAEKRRIERIATWHAQTRKIITLLLGVALFFGVGLGLYIQSRLKSVSAAFRGALEDQHRRTEELFRSEQNLRTTLTSIGDGVITCDSGGRVQMMNLVAQELTGWIEAEAAGKTVEEVFPIVNEATRSPVENPVAKVMRLNQIVSMANHTILIRRDGREIDIDDSGAPIRDESGSMTGVVLVFRDITVERKTRAALLANEKLAVAGRLAATIAHEIHNPLDSVSNLLFLIEHGSSEAESRQFLEMARTELGRVTQISRAMLSLYREAKAPVSINLKDMLDGLLLLMERRFADLGVTVSADLPPDLSIEGFPAELRQVFTNLITNAAEASGRGGHVAVRVVPTLSKRGGTGQQAEAGATIEISDTGPGISPEIRDRLFQPFFTTKGEQGTGLGLWVSQGIIRKHGGTIQMNSTTEGPNHGTTASVFLTTRAHIDPGGD